MTKATLQFTVIERRETVETVNEDVEETCWGRLFKMQIVVVRNAPSLVAKVRS